jgi:hypothetical protein
LSSLSALLLSYIPFFVAHMDRKRNAGTPLPDCAALHPGYKSEILW